MRIIGTLCYYDESPTWLAACITSMARVCDHIIALDGAYRLYPGGRPSSGQPSHEAVLKTAEAAGVGLTHYVPSTVFEDNEVEKRNVAFRLAEAIAEPERDWFFILDADEVVLEVPGTLREDLSVTPMDVASASMVTRIDWHANPQMEQLAQNGFAQSENLSESRRFYRAIPGLRAVGNHFTFVAERDDGLGPLTLRGADRFGVDPSLNTGLLIEHRSTQRTMERDEAKKDYYRRRDASQAELPPAEVVIA